MKRLLPIALGILITPAAAAPLDNRTDDHPTARAAALIDREEDVIDALDELDRRIAEVALEQARLAGHRTQKATALAEIDARITAARARITTARAHLTTRLRARARLTAAADHLPALTGRPRDTLRRRGLLRAVLHQDLLLIRRLRADEAALHALRPQHAAATAALEATEAEVAAQRATLEDERAVRTALLATVRGQRRLAERLTAARAARLDTLPLAAAAAVTLVAGAVAATAAFADHKGQLPPPVAGRLLTRFGRARDPELGTITFNTGIALDAPHGAPVRAVHQGRVVYSGWYKGFGNLVIIDHGDDFHTLYGHLSAIRRARGETVATGTIIGEVGDAGSLGGPRLHFEIRARRAPVDPVPWLRRR